MATVHFTNVVKIGVEVHEFNSDKSRTAFHLLIDSRNLKGEISHEEVIIMWGGNKESLLSQIGLTLPEQNQ